MLVIICKAIKNKNTFGESFYFILFYFTTFLHDSFIQVASPDL